MSETQNGNAVAVVAQSTEVAGFNTAAGFELMQRVAGALVTSDLVPQAYKGKEKLGNAIIALSLAQRIGAEPLMVMQNLHVIHGRPSWSAQFIISAINSCGKFSPLRFRVTGEGAAKSCVAYAIEKATGEVLEGPPVSMEMAKAEGWLGKSGSKWQTMPDLMLRYRAASFFGRLYAPEILMGMQSVDEVEDMVDVTPPAPSAAADLNAAIKAAPQPQQPAEKPARRGRQAKVIDVEPAGQSEVEAESQPQQAAPEPEPVVEDGGAPQVSEQPSQGVKLW